MFAVGTEIFWTKIDFDNVHKRGEQRTRYLSTILSHLLVWELCVFDSRGRGNHVYCSVKMCDRGGEGSWYFKGRRDWNLMLLHMQPRKNSQMINCIELNNGRWTSVFWSVSMLQENHLPGAAIGTFLLLVPYNPFLSTSGKYFPVPKGGSHMCKGRTPVS